MGAIFFYIFIFFLGYYGANVLNMITVRPWVTNRYIAALFPVYGIAVAHAYMISTKPLPPGGNITIESALIEFVALPVVVVTMGAVYFMWNGKENREEEEATAAPGGSKTGNSGETDAASSKSQTDEIQSDKAATAHQKNEETRQ
ncbi:MAG: hypothetical protein LZF61_10745 [Nitrosomonas sp.]|nr:MAG: hypothetical protein LZF61_10745 [Nitrosomonas sp.]